MEPHLSITTKYDQWLTVVGSICLTGESKNATDTKIMTAIKFADAFFNDKAMNTDAGLEFDLRACGTSVLTLIKYLMAPVIAAPISWTANQDDYTTYVTTCMILKQTQPVDI